MTHFPREVRIRYEASSAEQTQLRPFDLARYIAMCRRPLRSPQLLLAALA